MDNFRRFWRAVFWPAALIALGLGFALVPLAQGKLFFYRDNAKQHFAQTQFLHDSLREGSIPHWWPAAGLGVPVMAEGQAAHYSPLRLLLAWLLSPSAALMWEVGLCIALSGLGTYLFLRQVRASRPASALGGVVQMFGSFSMVFLRNMALHRSMWLFPFAMLFAERFATRKRIRDLLGAGIVFGLQLLSGHPTIAVVTIVSATAYLCVRVLQQSWRKREPLPDVARRLGVAVCGWGCALALGLGISAVQIIPMLKQVPQSIRSGGLKFEYAAYSPVRPSGLGMLLLPYAYPPASEGIEPAPEAGKYINANLNRTSGIYAGTLPIVLAMLAVAWSRRISSRGAAFAACWVLATALALGHRTPLFPALWSLPGMGGQRVPHRFLLWSMFCLAVLCALGMDRVRRNARVRKTIRAAKSNLPIAGVSALCAAVCGMAWYFLPMGRRETLTSVLLMCIALALLAALERLPARAKPVAVAFLLLFTVADLLAFRERGRHALLVPESEALAPPAPVEYLKRQPGQFRVMSLVLVEDNRTGNEDLRQLVQADLCQIWGLESMDFYASLIPQRYLALREGIVVELSQRPESASKLAGYLGALNVGFVIAPKDIVLQGWENVFQTPVSTIWKNPALLPRSYLVGEMLAEKMETNAERYQTARRRLSHYYDSVQDWGKISQDAEILDQILLEPLDYTGKAVVDRAMGAFSGDRSKPGKVSRVASPRDTMVFETESKNPALLVTGESYAPGWRARVNGREAEIVRANWLLMGVAVPAGSSRVEMHYVTPGFRIGSVVTALSLLLAVAMWCAPRWLEHMGTKASSK